MGKPPLYVSQESAPALPRHCTSQSSITASRALAPPGRLPASGCHKTVFVKVSRCCQEASGSISHTQIGT